MVIYVPLESSPSTFFRQAVPPKEVNMHYRIFEYKTTEALNDKLPEGFYGTLATTDDGTAVLQVRDSDDTVLVEAQTLGLLMNEMSIQMGRRWMIVNALAEYKNDY